MIALNISNDKKLSILVQPPLWLRWLMSLKQNYSSKWQIFYRSSIPSLLPPPKPNRKPSASLTVNNALSSLAPQPQSQSVGSHNNTISAPKVCIRYYYYWHDEMHLDMVYDISWSLCNDDDEDWCAYRSLSDCLPSPGAAAAANDQRPVDRPTPARISIVSGLNERRAALL